jgi:hypothetical protein
MSLVEFGVSKFYPRWRRQLLADNNGISDPDLMSESGWDQLVRLSQPRRELATHHESVSATVADGISLSDNMQIFVLANVLRRPIIVVSSVGQTGSNSGSFTIGSAAPTPNVGGIYLPLLWQPEDCVRYPVVLASVNGRLLPLVGHSGPSAISGALDIIPVVTSQLESFRMWFLLDNEELNAYVLQQRYLNMTEVNFTRSHSVEMVLGARLRYESLDVSSTTAVCGGNVGTQVGGSSGHNREQRHASPGRRLPPPTVASVPGGLVSTERVVPVSSTCTHPANLPVANTKCREPGCGNCALWFMYPYCYTHIDRRVVESTIAHRPQTPAPALPEPSMMSVGCKMPGCHNLTSRFVYPYCYEHLELHNAAVTAPIGQTQSRRLALEEEHLASVSTERCIYPHCTNQASIYTYPVCYEHLDFFGLPPTTNTGPQHPSDVRHVETIVPVPLVSQSAAVPGTKYDELMAELEMRTRRSTVACRTQNCRNYGNSRCQGMCHECYSHFISGLPY